jgi:hypothetical protein
MAPGCIYEPPETRQEFLDIIKGEAEKLYRMTTRVLYFTELESEPQQPKNSREHPGHIFDHIQSHHLNGRN